MASLSERIAQQITALQDERERIERTHIESLAEVDGKLTALVEAQRVVTKEVEAAYVALLKLKLIKEV